MIRSMTGYSRVRAEEADFSLSASIKATNHRFLDLQVRLPAVLEPLEPHLRRVVKDHVTRGHVEVTISLEQAGPGGLELNRKMLAAYASACQQLRSEFGFTTEPDPVSLLRIPGMVGTGNGQLTPAELERIERAMEGVASETLHQLNQMRAREGEALEQDLRARLKRLEELSRNIDGLARRVPQLYQHRLETRIKELLGAVEVDRARLAQEVAYLASRSDISEELTRFGSHLDQAKRLLDQGEASEVGKKLDFLLQEMNREANTLLSKTTDVPEAGLEIARQAIEMKTEIEKLREQVQKARAPGGERHCDFGALRSGEINADPTPQDLPFRFDVFDILHDSSAEAGREGRAGLLLHVDAAFQALDRGGRVCRVGKGLRPPVWNSMEAGPRGPGGRQGRPA